MKICTKCKQNKDESEFSPKHSFTNKLKEWCKACNNKDCAERRLKKLTPVKS